MTFQKSSSETYHDLPNTEIFSKRRKIYPLYVREVKFNVINIIPQFI